MASFIGNLPENVVVGRNREENQYKLNQSGKALLIALEEEVILAETAGTMN